MNTTYTTHKFNMALENLPKIQFSKFTIPHSLHKSNLAKLYELRRTCAGITRTAHHHLVRLIFYLVVHFNVTTKQTFTSKETQGGVAEICYSRVSKKYIFLIGKCMPACLLKREITVITVLFQTQEDEHTS